MVKSNSLRVHLMMMLYDSFNSGLSHAESARIHGVGVSTSRYAARWCRRIHSAAESFVSRQGLNDLHYYRTMIARDIRESLSLQESCARHGCPPRTYRMWEYAYYSGLATQVPHEYPVKGFATNYDLMKQVCDGNYFDELLARIRDFRPPPKKKGLIPYDSGNLRPPYRL